MKIGILSDTHNDEVTVKTILASFLEESITTVIHCGDLSSPSMIPLLEGFQLYLAYGNCDYLTGQIAEKLNSLGTESKSGNVLSLKINEKSIGVIHGNDYHQLELMQQSGRYHYIFTGHTHQSSDTTHNGSRIINPGAAHSRGYHRATYATLNLETGVLVLKRL